MTAKHKPTKTGSSRPAAVPTGVEARARLWDVVLNRQLYIIPPETRGREWIARSVGGSHDPSPTCGSGRTPEEAVLNAVNDPQPVSEVGPKKKSRKRARRRGSTMSEEEARRLEEAIG